ncbi:hypothetical protein Q7P35_005918 [Cladosporium inversicolor]
MEQWKHLRQNDAQLPSLLVKASFGKNGYSIRLTDLSRIWAEELDKAEILSRARARNCSIDPGEDAEQYDIFNQKLQSALQQHGNTTLALSTMKNGNLKLHLEAPLPSPLPTFEWEMDLKQMSDRSVEVDLVSPLLQKACLLERHIQLLIAEIQAKDKVIGKITDRLETSGHDLTAVFPGVANVKTTGNKSKREQFARHVRALGEFDEASWSAKVATDNDGLPVSDDSADVILASLPPVNAEKETHLDWWRKIANGQHIGFTKGGLGDGATTRNRDLNHEQSFGGRSKSDVGDDNDDFQRQATPPHLRAHSKLPTSNGNVDESMHDQDSTEDDDDLDGPPSRSKPPRQAKHNITHALAPANTSTSSAPPPSKPTAHAATAYGPFTHEEDTEDDDDDLDGPSQASQKPSSSTSQLASREKSQTPQPPTSSAPSPRKRLGTLGGRARTKSPTPMSMTPIEEQAFSKPTSPSPEKPKAKPKLGTIGGRKAKPKPESPAPESEDVDTPPPKQGKKFGTIGGTKRETKSSRAPTASATPERQIKEPAEEHKQAVKAKPVEPEDPVERANAKRDALKRQLEEKAKAPVKKKRKF